MHLPPHTAVYIVIAAVFGAVNGIVHFVLGALIDEATARALIIGGVSAVIAGGFGIAIALIQRSSDRALHERMDRLETRAEDVAGAVGANRRSGDPDGGQETPGTSA